MKLRFTDLNGRKFRLGFNDSVNPVSMSTFSSAMPLIFYPEIEFFDNLYRHDPSFSKLDTKEKVAYLVYASTSNSSNLNKMLLNLLSNFLNQLIILISHLFLTNNILKLLLYLLQKRPLKGVLKNWCSWNSKM